MVVGFLLRGPIGDALEVSDDIVYAGLFGLWISMNYDVMARVYRIERRARAWVQYTLLNVVLTAVLTVVLVVWFDTGALGLLIGNFTGTAIVYAILIVARRETVGLRRFETPVLRELLVFSLPLMPANIALWALNLADRLQVQQLASHQALGSYSAAARVSMAMAMIMGAFQTAWAPYAHQVRGTEGDAKAKITYARVLTYWSVVMGWGLVGISLLAPPYIRATFPSSTFDAIPVVPLLAIGIVLYGCYLIVNIGVTVSRKTRMTPIICTFAAALNIGLNFWFIPEHGIVGAGITTVIGYAVLLWLGWWNAQRSYPVHYNWPRIGRVAVVVTVYLAASEWLIPQSGILWLSSAALAVAFPLALLASGAITRTEFQRGRDDHPPARLAVLVAPERHRGLGRRARVTPELAALACRVPHESSAGVWRSRRPRPWRRRRRRMSGAEVAQQAAEHDARRGGRRGRASSPAGGCARGRGAGRSAPARAAHPRPAPDGPPPPAPRRRPARRPSPAP